MSAVVTTDLASPAVLAIIDGFGNTRNLNARVAIGVRTLTVRHIVAISASRHRTANRLGATPTGELERSAKRVTSRSDETGVELEVPRFLFARAFASFWIRPTNGEFLTLPTHAASYGRRVGELRRMGWTLFRPRRRGTKARASRIDRRRTDGSVNRRSKVYGGGGLQPWLLGMKGKSTPVLLYLLKRAVYHQQDRTLLPSDEAFLNEARQVATNYALYLAQSKGLA